MLRIAYQVYSARDDAEKNLGDVLKALSDMGYNGVEFAGFYGYSADEINYFLKQYNLKAISSHVSPDLILEDMFAVISYHKKIGCEYIAIPYLGDDDRPGGRNFAKTLNWMYRFGALCKAAGIQLLYHNHDFEFIEFSGQYGLDFMYDAIPAEYLATEVDTCWVKYAGLNPADYIKKYAGRCPVVHLKDFVGSKGEESPYALINSDKEAGDVQDFAFTPVGHGSQDIPAIVKASIEGGAQWFVVEQDDAYQDTPLEAAKKSIDYLKSL